MPKQLLRLSLVSLFALCACVCSRKESNKAPQNFDIIKKFELSQSHFDENISFYTAAPHAFGSARQQELSTWLKEKTNGTIFEFTSETPNPKLIETPDAPAPLIFTKTGYNVFSLIDLKNNNTCLTLFGSHYDTKIIDGISYLGANDGGSSTVLLLEYYTYLTQHQDQIDLACDIGLIWFDGEEATLSKWDDGLKNHPAKTQDNTYGSREFVNSLSQCTDDTKHCLQYNKNNYKINALILFDMIGSPNAKITMDQTSTPSLKTLLQEAAVELSLEHMLSSNARAIADDHTPFIKADIPAIDIIDFNHLTYWHKSDDSKEHIDSKSIESIGKLGLYLGLQPHP